MSADGPHSGGLRALHVLVNDDRGRAAASRGLGPWLRRLAPAPARGVVNVSIVSDRQVRALNKRYRGKDAATDVLSFGGDAAAPRRPRSGPPVHLGDIVIARGVARRQARARGHSEATEVRVLALHGLLHLLGYDHERDGGAMRRLERRLRRRGGLREGLIERA
jgi:probable rRNA maturation factor